MKKNIFLIILFASHIMTFAQKRYFTPAAYQVNTFNGPGQISLSVARGNGYDANLSFSVTKDISLLFAYGINDLYEHRSTIFSLYGIQNNNSTFLTRIGYFKNINKPGLSSFESYLGFSKTKIDNYWSFETDPLWSEAAEHAKAAYWSAILGTDLVLNVGFVEFSLGLRCNIFKYDSLTFYEPTPFTYYPTSHVEDLKGLNGEMIMGLGFKLKKLKLLIQGGASIPLVSPYDIQKDIYYTNFSGTTVTTHKEKHQLGSFIFRIGLQYSFHIKKK